MLMFIMFPVIAVEHQRIAQNNSKKGECPWGLSFTGEWKAPLSLTALMDIPAVLTRFVPTFDTLLLDVKVTAPEVLTQTRHPLEWLLTVLQHEDSDAPVMRQALLDVLER